MTEQQSIFSNEDCKEILQNCFHDNWTKIKYLSHKFRSLSGDVEGYLSEHYLLSISYEEDENTTEVDFFVKAILQHNGFLAEFAKDMDVFRKESFIYIQFFEELKTKLNTYKSILPKCYFAKRDILVLENLCREGYHTAERLKFYNVTQCKMALKTIAYYHAYSIIYEELKSKETNTTFRLNITYPVEFTDKFRGSSKVSTTTKFLAASLQTLCDLVQVLPTDKIPNKDDFVQLLRRNLEEETPEDKLPKKYRLVCAHGDLWPNNIMFKYENDELIDCKLIDFQMLDYAMPGYDVEVFFYGNTTAEFRKNHKTELMHYYYDCFSSVLEENDIDVSEIMSFEDLQQMCIIEGPKSKAQAISDLSLLYLPEEVHLEAAKNPDHIKTVLIDERSKYILDIFHSNSQYRDIIINELVDFKNVIEIKEKFLSSI